MLRRAIADEGLANTIFGVFHANGGDAPRCKQTGHPRRRRIKIVLLGSDSIPKLDTDALYPRCKHRGIDIKIKYKIYSVKEIAHLSAFSIYRLLLHALNTFSAFISSNLRLRFIFLSRASLIAAILHLLEYLLSHRKAPNWRAECIMIMVLLPLSFSSSLM